MTLMNVDPAPRHLQVAAAGGSVFCSVCSPSSLLFGPHALTGRTASLLDAATKAKIAGKLKPLGVLWH